MKIGVLALQGAFREHLAMLRRLNQEAVEVRLPEQLQDLDGLIIPGGESTTIGKLATDFGLIPAIREMVARGKPVWGTCAGMIMLAQDVGGDNPSVRPPLIGAMDVKVKRNAFGRQVQSFEADLHVPAIERESSRSPFHGVFIRAPLIESVGPGVEVLATLQDGTIVAARQGNLLATSFHPELTGDTRFHELFLRRIEAEKDE